MRDPESNLDVIVRTYNSGTTLKGCLKSVKNLVVYNRIIVVDRHSTDSTLEISKEFEADVFTEDLGISYATRTGIELAKSQWILFVDSDVTLVRNDFTKKALLMFGMKNTGAVIGTAIGHPFAYGLPLGCSLFRKNLLEKIVFPDNLQGRETYFIQMELKKKNLRVRYVRNCIIHSSPYRSYRYWPEFQGANVRLSSGFSFRHLIYSYLVIFLMLSNRKNLRSFAYIPIFVAKLTAGFLNPYSWNQPCRTG